MNNITGINQDEWALWAANSPWCDIIWKNWEVIWAEPLIHPDPKIAREISIAAFKAVFFDTLDPYAIARIDEIPYSPISINGTIIMTDIKKQYGEIF